MLWPAGRYTGGAVRPREVGIEACATSYHHYKPALDLVKTRTGIRYHVT